MSERIGVIGGTGLYQMDDLECKEEVKISTPFGEPSDVYTTGEIAGKSVVFLPRHGKGHRLLPTEINYRANVFGLKTLGVTHLISVSAVGSMKEKYQPGHVVVPDQFFDRTRQRPSTFFGGGLVAHVSLADPTCPHLSLKAAEALTAAGAVVHLGGTYLCMEGPQFSTRAESMIYRQWGVDVIGMTNMSEARLAREAEMCYSCWAFVTDFDCWKQDEEAVSGESVMAVLARNVKKAQKALRSLLASLEEDSSTCDCREALRRALITSFEDVPEETLKALAPLIARYHTS